MKKLFALLFNTLLVYLVHSQSGITSPETDAVYYAGESINVTWVYAAASSCIDCDCDGECESRTEALACRQEPGYCTIESVSDDQWSVNTRNLDNDNYSPHGVITCTSGNCTMNIAIDENDGDGEYEISVIGNRKTFTKSIIVYTRPSNPAAPTEDTGSDCRDRRLKTTSSAPADVTFFWQKDGGSQQTTNGSGTTLNPGEGTHIYALQARRTISAGEYVWSTSPTSSITVTEYAALMNHTFNASDDSLCPDESARLTLLTSTEGITYRLYREGLATSLVTKSGVDADETNTSIDFGSHSTAGEYYVIASDACGTLEMSDRKTITSNSGNTVAIAFTRTGGNFSTDANGNMYACSGESTTLSINTTGVTLTDWYWTKNGSKINGSDEETTLDVDDSGNYSLVISSSILDTENCYSGTVTAPSRTITIHDAVDDLSDITVDFWQCETSRTISFGQPTDQVIQWYNNSNTAISTPDLDNLTARATAYTYKVKASNNESPRECLSANFATVTINVKPTPANPTVYGNDEYCNNDQPTSDILYVRDVDPFCNDYELRANNGTSIIDDELKWDENERMHYFTFRTRSSPGSKTLKAYKGNTHFATFTQTINATNTPSVSLTATGGNFSYDANGNMYACAGESTTLGINTTGVTLTDWYWTKNGSKINGSDEDTTLDIDDSGNYSLVISSSILDTDNCYSGTVTAPSRTITIHDAVDDLSDVTIDFWQCQTSRTISFEQPTDQVIKWYNNSNTAISPPDLDNLTARATAYTYKVKASNNESPRECLSANFATVTINVIPTPPNPTVYGNDEYCNNDQPTSDILYVRDVDPFCNDYELRANNGTTVIDDELKWDEELEMHYFTFDTRSSPGSKRLKAYKGNTHFATFTQTINATNTPSAAITYGGDFTFDETTLRSCDNGTLTLSTNIIGLNVTSWHWRRNGVKIGDSDNLESITVVQSGNYQLRLIDPTANASECYVGTVSNPSVQVEIQEIQNVQGGTFTFQECQTSREVTIDQLSDGSNLPAAYTIKWYETGDDEPLSNVPDWDALEVGTHEFRIKGEKVENNNTCVSSDFSNVTIIVQALGEVVFTSSISDREMGSGSSNFSATGNYVTNFDWTIEPSSAGEISSTGTVDWQSDFFGVANITVEPADCGTDVSTSTEVLVQNPFIQSLIAPSNNQVFMPGDDMEIIWPNDGYGWSYDIYYVQNETTISIANGISGTLQNGNLTYTWENVPVLGSIDIVVEESRSLLMLEASGVETVDQIEVETPLAQSYGKEIETDITWTGGSSQSNFTVELYEGGTLHSELGTSSYNNLPWTIPGNLSNSLEYQIRVSQGSQEAYSATFTVTGCVELVTLDEDKNYVRTMVPRVPVSECLDGRSKDEVIQSVAYVDGLGRPIQSIQINGSPVDNSGNTLDIIQHVDYDDYGRQLKSYLPHPGAGNVGAFQSDPITAQQAYYQQRFPNSNDGDYAYSEQIPEKSPLNRPSKTAAPGEVWSSTDDSHLIENVYLINDGSEEIPDVYVDDLGQVEIAANIFYSAGELSGLKVTDENNGPEEGETITWTNKSGQSVLKAVKIIEDNTVQYMKTLYGYDVFGNLRFVLQPQGVKMIEEGLYTWESLNDAGFQEKWMFTYSYDHRQRMISKSVPGADPVRMIYDFRDRLVLTQDGNQNLGEFITEQVRLGPDDLPTLESRYDVYGESIILEDGFTFTATSTETLHLKSHGETDLGNWTFTKYDPLNRPIMTGQMHILSDYNDIVGALDDHHIGGGAYGEAYTGSGPLFGYTNDAFPFEQEGGVALTEGDLLSVTYYDNYDFTTEDVPNGARTEVTGMVTGSKTRVLGTDTWLNTVTFYDERYRVMKTISDNYLGGQDVVVFEYLNAISGLVTRTTTIHTGGEPITIVEEHTYDHMDRLLTTTHQINEQDPVVIASNTYNVMGELVEKNVGGTVDDGNPVQSIDYDYNIRGWLTTINEGTASNSGEQDQFGMRLKYTDATGDFGQYNGNIGQILWTILGGNGEPTTEQQFNYIYDAASRIQSANYVGGAHDLNSIDYDFNGNITQLTRNTFDVLTYEYGDGTAKSNQLLAVRDDGDATLFHDQHTSGDDYAYDDNGNLTQDLNKGITSIQYNYLNLPERVTFQNGNTVAYTYDAGGTKLRKVSRQGANVTTTDYVGGLHFTNNALAFLQHAEGRVVKSGTLNFEQGGTMGGSIFNYEYNLTDHLGNVRASVAQGADGPEVVQRDDYYPFGLSFNSWTSGTENLYKYNNKEEQKETGWFDYGARFYDPELGRWHVQDPYSGLMRSVSPYAYAFNNPLKFEDKDGFIPWPKIFGRKRNAVVTSGFGNRTHPVTGETKKFHNGVDLWAPEGTQVRSLAGGKVTKVGSNRISGIYVVVDHGHGYVTKYAHLQTTKVKKGDRVIDGMDIGTVGQTGRATGPHTHLILESNGVEIDPTTIFDLAVKIARIESAQDLVDYMAEKVQKQKEEANKDGEVSAAEQHILDWYKELLSDFEKDLEEAKSDDSDDDSEEDDDNESSNDEEEEDDN